MNIKWIYRIEEIVKYNSGMSFPENYLFRDNNKVNKIRMAITKDGMIFILPNYSWDGCSPKFFFLDIYFGTPDGIIHEDTLKPKTYYASLFHDALYQFFKKGGPYSIKDADKIFRKLMKKYDFRLSSIYYFVVRGLGDLWRCILNLKRKNSGSMEIVHSDHYELLNIINHPHMSL